MGLAAGVCPPVWDLGVSGTRKRRRRRRRQAAIRVVPVVFPPG